MKKPASRTSELALYALVGMACGTLAMFSLRTRWFLSGHRYSPYRYSEIGGVFLALVDATFAFVSGAMLAVGATARWVNQSTVPYKWPWIVDLLSSLVLAYLFVAANLGK